MSKNVKTEMTQHEALEIVLAFAKLLIKGHGEIPANAGTPHKAHLAIRLVRDMIIGKLHNNARATSIWKCSDCGSKSEGHTFEQIQKNGIPTCNGAYMKLYAVVIDGVNQKV